MKPWLIFHPEVNLQDAELSQSNKPVPANFDDEAYANEAIVLNWIGEEFIIFIIWEVPFAGLTQVSHELWIGAPHRRFVSLNTPSFYRTAPVLEPLQKRFITPSMIPVGCTTLIKVIDISINWLSKTI